MNKLLLTLTLAVSLIATPVLSKTIRIGTEGAYAPYNYIDDNGKLAGYEIDLGNALCTEARLTCEFITNEWDSIIPNLVAGNYDMIMAGMSITDERKKSINFSDEYYPAEPSRYAATTGDTFDFAALKGKKIGVQGATIHAAYAENTLAANNTILSFETFDQAIADLAAGNIDLFLADGDPLDAVVKASQGAISYVGEGIRIGGGLGIGLRQKDAELTDTLNKALESLKKKGTVDKLIKEYFKDGPFYSK
ncbi:MAG: transporter substrate-binding domain-containing protein [Thermodesulfobacteriota bacterium]|nr:transporter substrate-binding domain-containing protein [Thermodesulfobacteriota bacterium]